MAECDIGDVKNVSYKTKHVEWRIPDFLTDQKDVIYKSPIFSTADSSWCLRLKPRWNKNQEFVLIDICNKVRGKDTFRYCFGLKKCDGTVKDLVCGNMDGNRKYSVWETLIKKSELLQQETELLPSDILTVTCTVKWGTAISQSTDHFKLIGLDKLSGSFKNLFADKESCDVTLNVKSKEYKAHRHVLMARSSVFAANFKHDTLERQKGVITITDCDPDTFQEFLEYLYCGKLKDLSFNSALNLYCTSDKYDVQDLKEFCVEYLRHNITVDTVCEVAALADKYDEIKLSEVIQDFFNENSLEIFLTSGWESLLKDDYRLVKKLLTEMSRKKLKL